jgi:dephospho-CoA kinase
MEAGSKMIIGLSGYAQVGKDTVAQILVEEYGYSRIGFADIIRNACYRLNPIVTLEGLRLAHVVDLEGWDIAKQLPEVRRILQVMGTEVGRDLIDPQIWVELTLHNTSKKDKIVIPDVRFKNEAEEIKWRGGQIWRVSRIDKDSPVNLHRSETEMDSWSFDHYVANNGTIEDLQDEVARVWKA